jgi:hypothetical protein
MALREIFTGKEYAHLPYHLGLNTGASIENLTFPCRVNISFLIYLVLSCRA